MRDLHECQAEVFRRSEKRIKTRRQRRKHIAIACVPLVLCVILATPLLWPEEKAIGPGASESVTGSLQENANESFTCSIAQITVAGGGFSRTFTGDSQVLPIWDGLTQTPQGSGGMISSPAHQENTGRGSETAGLEYTITLVMRYGEKIEYLLSGNTLKDLTADQTHILSEKQANTLYDLLGIPRAK